MLKKVMSLFAVAAMLQGSASADWASDVMCGNFWVAGEALLLRPTGAYPYVTLIGPETEFPQGAQVACCPDYEWGYKIEVGYRNCGKEILINWLSWNNGYTNKFKAGNGQFVWNTGGNVGATGPFQSGPAVVRSVNCLKYDALDVELAKWECKDCSNWETRGFFGLRYARVRNGRSVASVTTDGVLVERLVSFSDVQGTGPRVGLGARWNVWCDFGLTGSTAGHLLIGSAKSQFVDTFLPGDANETVANIKNRKVCRIIPASEIKFGVDWRGCLFCGFSGILEVGYQITHYFYGDQSTLLTQTGSNSPNFATNHVHTDPISFDGWYFRLGLMY